MAEVTVTGTKETEQALNNFVKDFKDSQSLNKEIGSIISKQASALAPRKTGALAKSVTYEAKASTATIIAGNDVVKYAPIIEYGWQRGGRNPQPYINPAIKQNMGLVINKYEDEAKQVIKKYNLD
jgi:hypothetical protein